MAEYIVWATLLCASTADVLITGLVKKGYSVAPVGANKIIAQDSNDVASLVALQVGVSSDGDEQIPIVQLPEIRDKRLSKLLVNTKEALKGYNYFSLIVVEFGGAASWAGSNIQIPLKSLGSPPWSE